MIFPLLRPSANILVWTSVFMSFPLSACAQVTTLDSVPQLDGQHFRITILQEDGFVDTSIDKDGQFTFSGYLVDMIEALSLEKRANFTYDLLSPSGYGSTCSPQLSSNDYADSYSEKYLTQYNCGASDVNDAPFQNHTTDMYLGLYYITPTRQRSNQFTIPFLPPSSGTLQMFGFATGIPDFESLVEQQAAGLQPAACAPGGTALIQFVKTAYPGLQVQDVFGGENEIYNAFKDGTCQVYIVDGPVAAQFVLRLSRRDACTVSDGQPIGLIGQPMDFGVSHYGIGIRRDMPSEVEKTMSYWLNVLMSCSPMDPKGECPDGNLATFYDGQGGTGAECGYVPFPPMSNNLGAGPIVGIIAGWVVFVAIVGCLLHRCRIRRQERKYAKRAKAANVLTQRERELNEFVAHEIRNPLASAIAALSFVSSKTGDPSIIPNSVDRDFVNSDVGVIESSLQFVNELLRNMLDLHRSANKEITLDLIPTDILRDVFEPVSSILFMRGAKVDIIVDCPNNVIVKTDRMRLKQIFLNLASNASKFVEKGFIRLRAEVWDTNINLYVEDSGPGIPLAKQQLLFAKFQESLDMLNQGTGIGLCVCKNLSKLMGADLFLDQDFDSGVPGCPGTRFTLRLNTTIHSFESSLSSLAQLESARYISTDLTGELPESLSVLFVDDDTVLRKMFSRSIQRVAPTWLITEASNGETSLRLTESQTFDLIFMDEYMASVEKQLLGSETVRLLRARGVKSLICGLSANDKEEHFLEAGADAFMLKPFPCQKDLLEDELIRKLFPPKKVNTKES